MPNTTNHKLTSLNAAAKVSNCRSNRWLKALNYGNGRRLTLNYEAMRQEPVSMLVDRSDNPGDKIMDYEYEYYQNMGGQMRHEGRLRKITDKLDAAYTTEFSYDHAERLTGATAAAYTRGYGFDAWGNLTSVTGSGGPSFQGYTLNYEAGPFGGPATNRILNVNGTLPYTYDAAGNLTAAEGRNYAYDGASRLTSVNGGTLGQYGYDGDGLRVKKVEGGGATYYVRSSVLGQALMEVTSAGVQRAYVYAPNGKLLAQRSTDGQFYWVHTDHLNSGRKLTDVNGTVIYRAEFDPHGQVLLEWAASGNTNLNTKKFATYERDAGTGLDYAGARMYANARGRFMQADPLGAASADLKRPQSLNRYAYSENDPINKFDPSGLLTIYLPGSFSNGNYGSVGTAFYDRVRQTFGEQVRVFDWGGPNPVLHPIDALPPTWIIAGARLSDYIADYFRTFATPGERLNIIAHSNGVNVAKYYTNQYNAKPINTLVSLAGYHVPLPLAGGSLPSRIGVPGLTGGLDMRKVYNYVNVYSSNDAVVLSPFKKDRCALNIGVNQVTRVTSTGQRYIDPVSHSDVHTAEVWDEMNAWLTRARLDVFFRKVNGSRNSDGGCGRDAWDSGIRTTGRLNDN